MRFLRGGTLTLFLKSMAPDDVHGIFFAQAAAAHVSPDLVVQSLVFPRLQAVAHVLG
jgi:hypothetical protein